MSELIRTEEELNDLRELTGWKLGAGDRMAATIRALWQYNREAKAVADVMCDDANGMRPVYEAALAVEALYVSRHRQGKVWGILPDEEEALDALRAAVLALRKR